jgi:subtilase family serine protease
VAAVAALASTMFAGSYVAGAAPGPPPGGPGQGFAHAEAAVCGLPAPGSARCLVHVLKRGDGVAPDATPSPTGLSPTQIRAAYGWQGIGDGTGKTIAIVDAYDDPTAGNDLNVFSAQFGIPCNGCFNKVVQLDASNNPPPPDPGWALEISLDIQWAHAIAPGAHILLVEALDASYANLMAAEDYASSHAEYVSNSWGGSEFCFLFLCETIYDAHFSTPGVSYFAASGDNGLPASYPSASPNVISVGGTTLHFDAGGAFSSETGWSGSGGGCSAYESATAAQSSFGEYAQVQCQGKRATPDVALDADPNSGVSVYDSTPYNNQTGWWTVGGTSASSPMWAARAADQGAVVTSATVYGGSIPFRDITDGDNGASALVGFDLVTGRGTWATAVALQPPGAPGGLTATGGVGAVALTWSAPTTGGPAQSYNVYRGTASNSEVVLVTGVGTTSYTDSNVTAGVTYYYEVAAVNGAGVGPRSGEAFAAPTGPTDVPPVASFTTSCSGSTCTFTSTSTDPDGSIASYSWSGGNGLTGSAASIGHTYTAKGAFAVNLTVVDDGGQSASASTTVTCANGKRHQLVCS